ncbi:MAG TPA: DNA methyltransferase [Pirellulales bacterium]|jgi:site-specific DNA-methyltransferase (adenine-specific)|nr:DNA methyltransferase [Pirellulales bacterium]
MNTLFYGDNLDVLRLHVKDESVDLIYLDPPFNSDQNYNVLFAEQDGSRSAAQIKAFGDTWRWDQASSAAYHQTVEAGGQASLVLQAFRQAIGENDMLAYLSMMAPRLIELRRVLKPTGSLYLHCDMTASHYLKILLDAIFGPDHFISEIIWKRTHSHGDPKRKYGAITDTIFLYGKTDEYLFAPQYRPFEAEYIQSTFKGTDDDGRRWQSVTLRSPHPRPNLTYDYTASNGVTYRPHRNGWSCDPERMEKYDRELRLHFPAKSTGALRLKMYLDESPGVKIQNLWLDINPIGAQAAERLGYPTQKPEALLERIIETSSNEGDTVLDPFCGCGTAIAAAERLRRRWIGIDITNLAIALIKNRITTAFGGAAEFETIGEPVSLPDARALAAQDPYQFQWWALWLVGARPAEQKKGADKGIDGRIFFHDEWAAGGGPTKQIILSVKAGHAGVAHVRDLRGVLDREKAPIGVLLTMEEPTRPMKQEAASVGFYKSPWSQEDYPRLQILTIEELLNGKKIDAPPSRGPEFKAAPKAKRKPTHRQRELGE